jgi:PAS domain S-box-containing protein
MVEPASLPDAGENPEDRNYTEFVRDVFMDLLEAIFASGFDTVLLMDDQRHFTIANQQAPVLLGAARAEILSRRLDDFTPSERRNKLPRLWTQLRNRGALEGRYELQRGDGLRVAVEFRARWSIAPGRHLLILRELMNARPGFASGDAAPLTPREREILQHVSVGRSNREIAGVLYLSPATVKIHLERIYAKLDVTNRAEAVARALRDGLIG